MATDRQLDERISKWLEAEAPGQMPDSVLRTTFERTRKSRQHLGFRALLGTLMMSRFVPALGSIAVVLVAAALALNFVASQQGGFGSSPSATPIGTAPPPSGDLGSFEPVAGRIVCGTQKGIWGVDPASAGAILGCSHDGTRLLVQKHDENLFVLDADGSETQVTEQLSGITRFLVGSARPVGATISPDGSRVVFAGLTKPVEEARSCHDGALFAVDADGGPAEVLWKSQVPQNGIVRYPTFSPDGTQIAFVDDYCDHNHNVWVMNADGSDAHQIVSDPLGAGHVRGLAWSAAGDRIALSSDVGTYTFARDGSDFTKEGDASEFCWPGRQC